MYVMYTSYKRLVRYSDFKIWIQCFSFTNNVLKDTCINGVKNLEKNYYVVPKLYLIFNTEFWIGNWDKIDISEKDISSFWFSKEQVKTFNSKRTETNNYFLRLSDNKIINYSEVTDLDKNPSGWDDMQYLGDGIIFSIDGIVQ